jgi:hypothetical protein
VAFLKELSMLGTPALRKCNVPLLPYCKISAATESFHHSDVAEGGEADFE